MNSPGVPGQYPSPQGWQPQQPGAAWPQQQPAGGWPQQQQPAGGWSQQQPPAGGWPQPQWPVQQYPPSVPPAGWPQSQPNMWVQPPPRRRNRWIWITVAIVVVVALGAGTAIFLMRSRSNEPRLWVSPPESVLSHPYPTKPVAGWSVSIRDVAQKANANLDGMEWGIGAKNYGNALLATVREYGRDDEALLVAINTTSGEILWTTPNEGHGAYQCADEAVNDMLICSRKLTDDYAGPYELRFYRVDTGELAKTEKVSGLSAVNVSDGVVYTAGYTGDSAWMARGTVDDLTADWRVEHSFDDCKKPTYGGSVTVQGGFVTFANFVLEKGTGKQVNPSSTFADVLPGNQLVATTSCKNGSEDDRIKRDWEIIDASGATRWSQTTKGRAWVVSEPDAGRGAPYFIGSTAFDSATGQQLWSAPDDISIGRVLGSTVLGTDDGGTSSDYDDDTTVAFNVETGNQMWRLDDSDYCSLYDGQRCISSFYKNSKGEVRAYNVSTGQDDWSFGDVDGYPEVNRAGNGFVILDDEAKETARVTFYPPT